MSGPMETGRYTRRARGGLGGLVVGTMLLGPAAHAEEAPPGTVWSKTVGVGYTSCSDRILPSSTCPWRLATYGSLRRTAPTSWAQVELPYAWPNRSPTLVLSGGTRVGKPAIHMELGPTVAVAAIDQLDLAPGTLLTLEYRPDLWGLPQWWTRHLKDTRHRLSMGARYRLRSDELTVVSSFAWHHRSRGPSPGIQGWTTSPPLRQPLPAPRERRLGEQTPAVDPRDALVFTLTWE